MGENKLYKIPNEYYLRLHHPRPRFKNNVESVLNYIASVISDIGKQPRSVFNAKLFNQIKLFPGNLDRSDKTINNWRTEISALFGFVQEEGEFLKPGRRALELSETEDLIKFFKLFCYHFQYPGGHIKPHANMYLIENNVDFKPAHYILSMLETAERETGVRVGISKAEATHCIFNDLRVTRDKRCVKSTWDLLIQNKKNNMQYDNTGDTVRYAGDILDYMVLANLVVLQPNGKYYINQTEMLAIKRFIQDLNKPQFSYYDKIKDKEQLTLQDIRLIGKSWYDYVNSERDESFFDTDILQLISPDEEGYNRVAEEISLEEIINQELKSTQKIGIVGESIIILHEKGRLREGGREDLIHLVKKIPDEYALGYDISSRELNEKHRHIEVKTTASRNHLNFYRFKLTPNEWTAAETNQDSYFVYRLLVTPENVRLVLLQNPVKLYKENLISASPRNGMDITFSIEKCGVEEKLII